MKNLQNNYLNKINTLYKTNNINKCSDRHYIRHLHSEGIILNYILLILVSLNLHTPTKKGLIIKYIDELIGAMGLYVI